MLPVPCPHFLILSRSEHNTLTSICHSLHILRISHSIILLPKLSPLPVQQAGIARTLCLLETSLKQRGYRKSSCLALSGITLRPILSTVSQKLPHRIKLQSSTVAAALASLILMLPCLLHFLLHSVSSSEPQNKMYFWL